MGFVRTLSFLPFFVGAPLLLCGCHGFGRAGASDLHTIAIEGEGQPPPSGLAGGQEAASSTTATSGDLVTTGVAPQPEEEEPSDESPSPPALERGGVPVASHYAALGRESCEAELGRRHVSFERVHVGEARGVVAPLRLTGPLSGVTFRSTLPPAQRRTSRLEIYDCRLVLALDDFAQMLAKHDIDEVIHLSVYRPVSAKTVLKGAGRRHNGALAIDAAIFKTKSGQTFSVEKDFHGRIGARPCPAPPNASELRKIACEANDARLFNVLLTPDFNWAHRNHFHLEVTAGVRWTLVR